MVSGHGRGHHTVGHYVVAYSIPKHKLPPINYGVCKSGHYAVAYFETRITGPRDRPRVVVVRFRVKEIPT